jgi:hypothetical protein
MRAAIQASTSSSTHATARSPIGTLWGNVPSFWPSYNSVVVRPVLERTIGKRRRLGINRLSNFRVAVSKVNETAAMTTAQGKKRLNHAAGAR